MCRAANVQGVGVTPGIRISEEMTGGGEARDLRSGALERRVRNSCEREEGATRVGGGGLRGMSARSGSPMRMDTVLLKVGLLSKARRPMKASGILLREPVREYVVAVVVERNLGMGGGAV